MRKKLTAIGNSLGVVIEKQVLDLLNVGRDTEFNVTTDGVRLILEPISPASGEHFSQVARRILEEHAPTFKKLAE